MKTIKLELLIKQYELAVSLWNSQHQAIWGMFNNVMLANSIFIAAIVILIVNMSCMTNIIAIGLCIVGILINIIWFIINWRGYKYQKLRINQGLYYEKRLNDLSRTKLDLISDGAKYSKSEIDETIRKKLNLESCDFVFRTIKTEYTSLSLISIFIIVYLFIPVFILGCYACNVFNS